MKLNHWERLEAQLKKYGKRYEIIPEKHQGHGFREPVAAVEFHRRLEAFLARYLATPS